MTQPGELVEFTIFSEHEKVLIAEDEARWKNAPKCHFRPMFKDESDYDVWWKCSVCEHTKPIYGGGER